MVSNLVKFHPYLIATIYNITITDYNKVSHSSIATYLGNPLYEVPKYPSTCRDDRLAWQHVAKISPVKLSSHQRRKICITIIDRCV